MINQNKPNLEKRTTRPTSLAGAFGGLLRLLGASVSDSDLAARWPDVVGAEIAGMATLIGISKSGKKADGKITARTLTVRTTVPAMATALQYRTGEIIKSVNRYFGYDAIGKVVVKK